jgi:hypothetical protein
MGMMGREAAVAIVETLDLPIEPEEYMSSSQKIMSQMFPSCKFLPGQLRVVRAHCLEYSLISLPAIYRRRMHDRSSLS